MLCVTVVRIVAKDLGNENMISKEEQYTRENAKKLFQNHLMTCIRKHYLEARMPFI
jgi:hypothetical protein